MSLYERQYGYTRLRVTVLVTELWLGVVFVLLVVAIDPARTWPGRTWSGSATPGEST
ncbi:DUF4153 domain-containing protein [Rhodococcus koreensis]